MHSNDKEENRTPTYRRNAELDDLLKSLNDVLGPAEDQLLASSSITGMDHPVIFIVGPLRSGTTLFTQWLANTGLVAYPTNLLSRFYAAPVIGAQIQMLLTDPRFNFRDEILDFTSTEPLSFSSENGKTKGALSPNEFWFFWRRFIPFQELDWLSDETLNRVVDKEKLVSELTALTRIFGKPFALKSMILNYNISFLDKIFKNALFIHLKRDSVTTIASILEARKRQLGSENNWYSFKIREFPKLKDLDPVTQCAGQLHYINVAVEKGMATVEEKRKLVVQYEAFCENPQQIFKQMLTKLDIPILSTTYVGPTFFKPSRTPNEKTTAAIKNALASFSKE